MITLKAVQEKIAKLQAQAQAIAREQASAIKKIGCLMDAHGLTTDDIAVGLRKPVASRKSTAGKTPATLAKAKYLNPRTGATWNGRGRAPTWIANAEDRSEFLVRGASTRAAVAQETPKAVPEGNAWQFPEEDKLPPAMRGTANPATEEAGAQTVGVPVSGHGGSGRQISIKEQARNG